MITSRPGRGWPRPPLLSRQLCRNLSDEIALETGAVKFDLARLTLPLRAGDRGRSIGRSADDFVETHLAGMAIGQTDDNHPEVHEIGDD